MSDVVIKTALSKDAEAVGEVIRAAYAPWVKMLSDLPDVSAGVTEDIASERVWVAVEGGEIVGCLIGGVITEQWQVTNVAVAPDHGGKGVGRALMTFAVARAKHEGATEMALATHRAMPGNIALYERLGWTVSGENGNKIMMRRRTYE